MRKPDASRNMLYFTIDCVGTVPPKFLCCCCVLLSSSVIYQLAGTHHQMSKNITTRWPGSPVGAGRAPLGTQPSMMQPDKYCFSSLSVQLLLEALCGVPSLSARPMGNSEYRSRAGLYGSLV